MKYFSFIWQIVDSFYRVFERCVYLLRFVCELDANSGLNSTDNKQNINT